MRLSHMQGPPVLEGGRPEAEEEGVQLHIDPEVVENPAGAEAFGAVPMMTDSDVQPTSSEQKNNPSISTSQLTAHQRFLHTGSSICVLT